MEEDVDVAVAEVSEAREQTPPADVPAQRTPPTPTHPARQPRVSTSTQT